MQQGALLTMALLTMALLTMALGRTYYGPTYYGPTYYGSTYELPFTSRGAMLLPPSYMELLVTQVGST